LNDEYVSISNLRAGKTYEQVFLIASVTCNIKMKTSQGKKFARVTLKDVTGEISGVVWDYDDELEEGGYATIKLDTKTYRDETEFQTNSSQITFADIPVNQHDYVKGVNDNILSAYAAEVQEEIMGIDDPIFRDIMGNALERLELMRALKESPYGISGPMSYKGGLLVHTAHSLRLAKVAIRQAVELELPFNASLVVAGGILRNIGWHTTTRFKGDHLRCKNAYYMIGIHRASARYIDHLIMTCKNDLEIAIPEGKHQALENMCNKRPEIHTLEGMIVSCADNMADVLDFSVAPLQRKQSGSWNDELFTGHL